MPWHNYQSLSLSIFFILASKAIGLTAFLALGWEVTLEDEKKFTEQVYGRIKTYLSSPTYTSYMYLIL